MNKIVADFDKYKILITEKVNNLKIAIY